MAFVEEPTLPASWESQLREHVKSLRGGVGDKALAIIGGYGSGKTYMLHWVARTLFPPMRIQPFFFDNPGLAFYDLANRLLRQVGRYQLSKAMWEMLYRPGEPGIQPALIKLQFPDWLATLKDRDTRTTAIRGLADSIRAAGLVSDEEVAHKFARLIVDTRERPYYKYRDFVPRSATTLVAEREEAVYFRTLIRALIKVMEIEGVAFLIDAFEDVALGRRLNKRQVSDYIATMRRLLDTAREEELWLVLSMTPEGFDQTNRLDPSLMERFSREFRIPLLTDEEAHALVSNRLASAPLESREGLWPFRDDAIIVLRPTTRSSPRRLIKVFWQTLALAAQRNLSPPIPNDTVRQAEQLAFPEEPA